MLILGSCLSSPIDLSGVVGDDQNWVYIACIYKMKMVSRWRWLSIFLLNGHRKGGLYPINDFKWLMFDVVVCCVIMNCPR